MKEWALQIINDYGYGGIYLLTALESIFPIIPAEFILTLSGYMTTVTRISKYGVILFATLGELTGALVLYSVGRFFNPVRLQKVTDSKVAHMIGFKTKDIYKAKDWFLHKGKYSILFGRCIPILGSLISIPAGMSQMNLLLFIVLTLIGITVWNTVLVTFGVTVKSSIDIIVKNISLLSDLLACVFIICFTIMGIYLIYNKHSKKSDQF